MDRLVIIVLGDQNSGKSTTWNVIVRSKKRSKTGNNWIKFNNEEYSKCFLVYGSPEERKMNVSEIILGTPQIVLCSTQYIGRAINTLKYFIENEYYIYCQWLNPGYSGNEKLQIFDKFGFMNLLLSAGATISIRNGKGSPNSRIGEILEFIRGWAHSRNLIEKY
jgi:GTPase SAR1 family protein